MRCSNDMRCWRKASSINLNMDLVTITSILRLSSDDRGKVVVGSGAAVVVVEATVVVVLLVVVGASTFIF